jgi:hypothetical protein
MANAGHVYILLNPSHKLLKIGKTTKTPDERAAELSSTGVPAPFMVAYSEKVSDCDLAETRIHAELAAFRVNGDREFFSASLKDAIKVVSKVAESFLIETVTAENMREAWQQYSLSPSDQKICDAVLALMALKFKQVEAHDAVRTAQKLLGENASVEDLVRTCLKQRVLNDPEYQIGK